MKRFIILFVFCILHVHFLKSQDSNVIKSASEEEGSIYDLTLEELFNVSVSSVSKKSESLFEAPLSASVVTKEEIKNAGVTTIPEALRLMPGLIVREQTNGIYQVFVRGGENPIPYGLLPYFTNAITLVMIDGRPIFNYLQGGTFWETLPIDLNDVERIELVRGAMAALYGPNAASGVINIITRKPKNYSFYSVANAHYGTNNTLIANGSLGYKWNHKFDFTVSGNLQQRDRYDDRYYTYASHDYVTRDQITNLFGNPVEGISSKWPRPETALDKKGANLFINFNPVDRIKFSLSAGLENSFFQEASAENTASTFSTGESRTHYGDLRIRAHNLSGQVSMIQGMQSPALNTLGLKYDMNSFDAFFEYDFIIAGARADELTNGALGEYSVHWLPEGHSISLRPGFNYRRAVYDDTPYFEDGSGFISGKGELETTALSVKVDYDISKKFRISAAGRSDAHNYPKDKKFLSYLMSAKYHINPKNIIRVTYSRAYRSVYIFDTYSNLSVEIAFPKAHPVYGMLATNTAQQLIANYGLDATTAQAWAPNMWNEVTYGFDYHGNRNLDLLKVDMLELGYRSRINRNTDLDLEGFFSSTEGFVYPSSFSQVSKMDTVDIYSPVSGVNLPVLNYSIMSEGVNINFEQKLVQVGLTISANYYRNNLQVKPYITLQKSWIHNFTPYRTVAAMPEVADTLRYEDIEHRGTPAWFGGAYINYHYKNWNINLNPWFMTDSEMYHNYYVKSSGDSNSAFVSGTIPEEAGHMQNQGKLLLNATARYQVHKNFNLFITGKNLTASRAREYFFTDQIPASVIAGINFEY